MARLATREGAAQRPRLQASAEQLPVAGRELSAEARLVRAGSEIHPRSDAAVSLLTACRRAGGAPWLSGAPSLRRGVRVPADGAGVCGKS
jgi:hypothetical protein